MDRQLYKETNEQTYKQIDRQVEVDRATPRNMWPGESVSLFPFLFMLMFMEANNKSKTLAQRLKDKITILAGQIAKKVIKL